MATPMLRRRCRRRVDAAAAVAAAAVLALVLSGAGGVGAIRLVQVAVPSLIQAGGSASLVCDVDMEDERLYAVKWYKDNEEFFRYVPRDSADFIVYDVRGVVVNRTHSNAQRVLVDEVGRASSGAYRCEVSAEAPAFSSVSGGGRMDVVFLPRHRPTISGGRSRYLPGDVVDVNCTSAQSLPAAKIRWFINDKKANPNLVRQYRFTSGEDGLETTMASLSFVVQEKHLADTGKLTLRCLASIAHLHSGDSAAAASTASLPPFDHLPPHQQHQQQQHQQHQQQQQQQHQQQLTNHQPFMESMEVRLEASGSKRWPSFGCWWLLTAVLALAGGQ